jgi:CspA family cold shock protein
MQQGRVKWFNDAKGYGFLNRLENGEAKAPDIFVHHSVIDMNGFRSLGEGEIVEYESIEVAGKGMQAKLVVRLDGQRAVA